MVLFHQINPISNTFLYIHAGMATDHSLLYWIHPCDQPAEFKFYWLIGCIPDNRELPISMHVMLSHPVFVFGHYMH